MAATWRRQARRLPRRVKIPAGYTIQWSGQYEYMENVKAKLFYVIPLTLLIIIVLIYLNTESFTKTMIVLLGGSLLARGHGLVPLPSWATT